MPNNHFKTAWRNFLKDRQFSLLNLLGLSTGLACTILIYLWATDELSIDKFHKNKGRLYQVMATIDLPDGIHTQENTPGLLSAALAKEFPEVEEAISVQPGYGTGTLSAGEKHVKASAQFAGKNFFSVFSYTFIAGNNEQALLNKHGILLSDEMAAKLYPGNENIIGKTVQWNDDKELYIVTGIFKKPGTNSSTKFDVLFSYELFFERNASNLENWGNSGPGTFLVLKKGTNIKALNNKIAGYLQTKADHSPLTLFLVKYGDKYLHGVFENGVQTGGRIEYVRLFSLVAIFILVIACINFMNLSTAKAERRLKEVGVRKILGARRPALVVQYLGESLFMAFLSLLLAIILVAVFIPQFNVLTGKQIGFNFNGNIIMALLAICFFTGLVSGSYPAFYLSRFKPVTVLKGKLQASWSQLWLRKGLVIFQFTLSVILIASVLVIQKQMTLIRTINLGYNKDNVVLFSNEGQLRKHFEPFVNEVKKLPGVMNISSMNGDMTGNFSGSTENISWEGKLPTEKIHITALDFDPEVIGMMNIQLEEGRSFSRDHQRDRLSVILNQAAVDAMGIKNPVDKELKVWGESYRIIGLVKNFHFESLYEKVKPCFIRSIHTGANILVKIKAGSERETLSSLGRLYKKYNLGLPFEYTFIDETYQAMYQSEQRVAILFRYFAGVAIIISCLGLFGLAAFTAHRREKEIGIRKVVGASLYNILGMLTKDFLKPIFVAVVIAIPISWWAMNNWLNGFAYHIPLQMLEFLAAATLVLVITILTISFQAIKAAITNPVKSLRTE